MEQNIIEIIKPSIENMGFNLVRVKMLDSLGRKVLQIMIERVNLTAVNVDDCAKVSETVSALLDVNDPIKFEYNLEVTSPGMNRPLVALNDYNRFKGFEAKIETVIMIEGRRRWRGNLLGVDGEDILVNVDNAEHKIPFIHIGNAKLILNDKLLKAHADGLITH